MVEREIKLRIADPKKVRREIAVRGFRVLHRRVFEANAVLDTPELALRSTGRLLRLREAGGENTLTFKGPQRGTKKHKSREEIESKISDFKNTQAIFEHIGFSVKFRYEKYRTEFQRHGEPGILMLDETPIGWFMELEGPGYWIDSVATELGYNKRDYVLESYGALYFRYCRENSLEVKHMVFQKPGKRAHATLGKTTLEASNLLNGANADVILPVSMSKRRRKSG
jgi:adenylate cyclase, class 2